MRLQSRQLRDLTAAFPVDLGVASIPGGRSDHDRRPTSLTELLRESRKIDWDGTVSSALQDRLGKAVADAPAPTAVAVIPAVCVGSDGRWEVVVAVVFVHGSPETSAVWGPLVEVLDRPDVTCLSPPGFGAPVPEDWGATVEGYRGWLISELTALGTPVDLVGHDWGGVHVVNVAMSRPDLLRSWCTDVIGIYDPDYVWHDLAQVLQTPSEGERAVGAMIGAPFAERAAGLIAAGMAAEVAEQLAPAVDEGMARCILGLYRSAVQPRMTELGRDLPAAGQRPGLVLYATEDHFVGTEAMHGRAAQRADARVEVLQGLGHWWMTQDPGRGAAALTRFWDSLPR